MTMRSANNVRSWFSFAVLAIPACTGDPVAVQPASIDAGAAAGQLLAAHDSNGNGSLSSEEASDCPGVAEQFGKYDADANEQLTRDEIASRFRSWSADGVGVMKVGCLVTIDGKRLSGANVRFEPLPCFSDALSTATGTTGAHGQCNLSVDPQELPASLQRVRGVQPGLYVVRITHPSDEIPANYNTASTLGQEVSPVAIGPEGIHFELTSR